MDSYQPSAAAFQRRLSRLYTDTKKSSDFVNVNMRDPAWKLAHEDPDIKALHRKLRIQKDRLVTWGLEWTEPGTDLASVSGSADEIDDALARAGLSEIVGSIMTTIKEILAEAEQLWLSFRRAGGSKGRSEKSGAVGGGVLGPQQPSSDVKPGLLVWDKGRFEDLVRDLAASIDTLYDLSRTRSAAGGRSALMAKAAKTPDERASAFETSRLQTPQLIDPAALSKMHEVKPRSSDQPRPAVFREIVVMNKTVAAAAAAAAAVASSSSPSALPEQPTPYQQQQQQQQQQLAQQQGRSQQTSPLSTHAQSSLSRTSRVVVPLMLEYAPFDSIYAATGIMPPMSRFEKLSSALQQDNQRASDSWSGLPALHGYFEDFEHSRLGLVYHFPPGFNAVSSDHTTQNTAYGLRSLRDLLNRRNFEPRLEARFRLAHNLANTVFDLHSRTTTHGNLQDTTVSFGNTTSTMEPGMLEAEIDIRRPMVSSFELFDGPTVPESVLYRHPLDPRTTASSPLDAARTDRRILDLYSLAMLLLQIGLWTSLDSIAPSPSGPIPESMLEQLAVRCGSLYMKAVKVCWTAVDDMMAGKSSSDTLLYNVQSKASRYLEACCILDGVTVLEEKLGHDLSSVSPAQSPVPSITMSPSGMTSTKDETFAASSSRAVKLARPRRPLSSVPVPSQRSRPFSEPVMSVPPIAAVSPLTQPPQTHQRPKSKIFDHVPLPSDAVRLWNTVTMPRVNTALRSFYRRNATESVEVSLASIGPSPQQSVPTVLVVCTSVKKVHSILTRKLADLFDNAASSPSALALKVCKGAVTRSRGSTGTPTVTPAPERSAARDRNRDSKVEDRQSLSKAPQEALANQHFQQVPTNGASLGAWIGFRHLPPVSLGGLVDIDGKTYGMTVHHMLDDPEDRDPHLPDPAPRSSAWQYPSMDQVLELRGDESSEGDSYDGIETSDGGWDIDSAAGMTSDSESYGSDELDDEDDEDDDDDEEQCEPGDIVGIEPGCGEGYHITQPALDDVDEDFFPSEETVDEDHLDTFGVGDVYASSGLRRRRQDGLVHEIDWALVEFTDDDRHPRANSLPPPIMSRSSSSRKPQPKAKPAEVKPITILPNTALPGLAVQCVGRTSGLQVGVILPALTSVKFHGRISPSQAYQVSSTSVKIKPSPSPLYISPDQGPLAIGLPGDSGAWVVACQTGAVCGHVLAWSPRKRVAYICPMDVLLQDIADTLCARRIRLPGGRVLVSGQGGKGVRGSMLEAPFVGDDGSEEESDSYLE